LGVMVYFIPPLFGEGFTTINSLLRGNVESVINNNVFNYTADNVSIVIMFLIGLNPF